MAILAFDTLKLAEKLAASGFTPEQAKGAASALSETMGEYLVTKEHFDRRIGETHMHFDRTIGELRGDMDTRFERVDARFEALESSIDSRFGKVDSRFDTLENSIDHRFEKVDNRFETLDASIDKRFAENELRLLTRIGAMFGATIAILVALDKLL